MCAFDILCVFANHGLIGTIPLLWAPVSKRIGQFPVSSFFHCLPSSPGRRPVYLVSMLLSSALQLASAYCTTYGTLMACRVLVSVFICPPQSIGASTVSEVFFVHQKGQKMGIWALLVSVGSTIAPLIMGPLVCRSRCMKTRLSIADMTLLTRPHRTVAMDVLLSRYHQLCPLRLIHLFLSRNVIRST